MSQAALTIKQAVIGYGTKTVVDGASVNLHAGQITALLGPSGSGKSSLLRAIAGLEVLKSGEIAFGETCWSGKAHHLAPEHRSCGVVFQDYALFPHLTALKNVMFGLKKLDGRSQRAQAMAQLEAVELSARANAYPHELSGGEQQRVAVARALATQPSVMLLDEAFSGLDRRLRTELRESTARILRSSGAATLLVTHDSDEALAMADTIALMHEGQIIQTGKADALYLSPVSEIAARLLGPVEVFDGVVTSGKVHTEIGSFMAPERDDGRPVKVLIRPEGISIDTDGATSGLVTARQMAVGHARITCTLNSGRSVEFHAPINTSVGVGEAISLSCDPHFASVVSA